jgi:hypothetical protein
MYLSVCYKKIYSLPFIRYTEKIFSIWSVKSRYFVCEEIRFLTVSMLNSGRGSSGSIVSDCWTTGVRSPTGAEDFSSRLCVHTGSVAHPLSCLRRLGLLQRIDCQADHPPLSSAEVKNTECGFSYTSCLYTSSWRHEWHTGNLKCTYYQKL